MVFILSTIIAFLMVLIGFIHLIIGVTYKNIKKTRIALFSFYGAFFIYLLPYKMYFKIQIHYTMYEIIKGLFL